MYFKDNTSQIQVFKPLFFIWKFYLVGKKDFWTAWLTLKSISNQRTSEIPLETNSIIQPPSPLEFPGSLTPPSPSEFSIPSLVGVWIFSGTTQCNSVEPINKTINNGPNDVRHHVLRMYNMYQGISCDILATCFCYYPLPWKVYLILAHLCCWKQVISPNVLFARSRFAWTESHFAPCMKSFRLRIENNFFFPTGSRNKENQVKLKFFFLVDHINPKKTKLSNKARWSIICRWIDSYLHLRAMCKMTTRGFATFARMTRHVMLHLMVTLRYTICFLSLHYRPGLSCRNVNLLHSARLISSE